MTLNFTFFHCSYNKLILFAALHFKFPPHFVGSEGHRESSKQTLESVNKGWCQKLLTWLKKKMYQILFRLCEPFPIERKNVLGARQRQNRPYAFPQDKVEQQ